MCIAGGHKLDSARKSGSGFISYLADILILQIFSLLGGGPVYFVVLMPCKGQPLSYNGALLG